MTSARWTEDLVRQMRRGRHVLLYGNVQDNVLYQGTHMSLHHCLDTILESEGYEVRGFHDIVDGITFSQDEMRAGFESLIRPPQISSTLGGIGYTMPGSGQPMRAGDGIRDCGQPWLAMPDVGFAAIRTALRESSVPCSFVVDFSDKLTTSPDQQGFEERAALVMLRKITAEARRLRRASVGGRRNLLILIASMLGHVPAWLYRNNPFLCTVEVELPLPEERRYFLSQSYSDFYQPYENAPNEVQLAEFADLTDGLSHWDLESLRLTSHHERIGLGHVHRLIDLFKHGERDDPWENLSPERLASAREVLRSRVIGQDAAVDAVIRTLVNAKVGVQISNTAGRSTRPKGIFFFVGPTGVGKTELAKALAELIFGDDSAFARFDMSEYSQEHAAEKLTGAPPSYVGYEAGGQLTNYIKRKPFTLVLFDEIEKAHGKIMDKFLQVLDDGRLTDGQGETVFFDQSIIVFTSNIGSTRQGEGAASVRPTSVSQEMDYASICEYYRSAVEEHLTHRLGRPELRNRLGENIIVFDILRPEYIAGIVKKFQNQIARSAMDKLGKKIVFESSVCSFIARRCTQMNQLSMGGRGIRNVFENTVIPDLNEYLFSRGDRAGDTIVVASSDGEASLEISEG